VITDLELLDFQPHRRLRLRLEPITTLVGPSDRGKSSVIRAVRWLVQNRPQGEQLVRHGAARAQVRVRIENHTVGRQRGSQNLYWLDKQEFRAFGSSVPEPIASFLNLGELNFQLQHDPLFLLASSPGEVARELNQIVDLSVIDRVLQALQSRQRENQSERKLLAARVESLEQTVQQTAWAPEALAQHTTLLAARRDLRQLSERAEQLFRAQQAVRAVQEELQTLRSVLGDGQDLTVEIQALAALRSRLRALWALGEQIRDLGLQIDQTVPDPSGLQQAAQRARKVTKRYQILQKLQRAALETQTSIQELDQQLERYRERKADHKVCPTCGREF